jgi:hypothetical protein
MRLYCLRTFYGGAIYNDVICLATSGIRHIIIVKKKAQQQ